MKEEMLEAIYGTVERLEQKVDELSASTKKTETGAIPVPVNVDTSKLEKAILSVSAKEEETISNLAKLREAICIYIDLTKKEASKDIIADRSTPYYKLKKYLKGRSVSDDKNKKSN